MSGRATVTELWVFPY